MAVEAAPDAECGEGRGGIGGTRKNHCLADIVLPRGARSARPHPSQSQARFESLKAADSVNLVVCLMRHIRELLRYGVAARNQRSLLILQGRKEIDGSATALDFLGLGFILGLHLRQLLRPLFAVDTPSHNASSKIAGTTRIRCACGGG